MTEVVEMCPHCESENVYPDWDAKKQGYTAVCQTCGKEIKLCDECYHAKDNPGHRCDWMDTPEGGHCFRDEPKLHPGDIVRNGYAGELNPYRDFLYLRKGTYGKGIHAQKTYDGLTCDGKKIKLFRDAPIEKIGHMDEYDAFMAALSRLAPTAADAAENTMQNAGRSAT